VGSGSGGLIHALWL